MAAKTLYLTDTLAGGWQTLSETSPGADTQASPATGWVVSTGATNRSKFEAATERPATTFDATTYPDGTLDTTLKDAWRSDVAYNGSFASANWTINGVVRAQNTGGAQDGRLYYRLFKADADGSNATEITGAAQQGALLTNVSTSADFNSSVTFNPGAFSITNQYLFIQLAWERTGAGGMTNSDINFRIGSTATRVDTSDFTAGSTNYDASLSETVTGPSESLTAVFAVDASLPETISGPSESLGAVYGGVADLTESWGAWGANVGVVFSAPITLSESLGSIGEAIDTIHTPAGTNYNADIGETVSLSESLGVLLSTIISLEESVSLSETVDQVAASQISLEETNALTENLVAAYAAVIGLTDTELSLSESIQQIYSAIEPLPETVPFAEQLTTLFSVVVGLGENPTLVEGINVVASNDSGTNYNADLSETASVSESMASAMGADVANSESISLSESLLIACSLIGSLTESLSLDESFAIMANAVVDIPETISLAELIAASHGREVILVETTTVDESTGTVAAFNVVFGESVSVSSDVTATGGLDVPVYVDVWWVYDNSIRHTYNPLACGTSTWEIIMRQGDLLPIFSARFFNKNEYVDFSFFSTLKFRMVNVDDPSIIIQGTAVGDANGNITYTWASGNTNTPGEYDAVIIANEGLPSQQTFPTNANIRITITPTI